QQQLFLLQRLANGLLQARAEHHARNLVVVEQVQELPRAPTQLQRLCLARAAHRVCDVLVADVLLQQQLVRLVPPALRNKRRAQQQQKKKAHGEKLVSSCTSSSTGQQKSGCSRNVDAVTQQVGS